MNRLVARIVTSLLVPCLLIDASWATPVSIRQSASAAFEQQALVEALGNFTWPRIGRASLIFMAAAGMVVAQESAPNKNKTSVDDLKNEYEQGYSMEQLEPLLEKIEFDAERYLVSQQNTIPANGQLTAPGKVNISPNRQVLDAYKNANVFWQMLVEDIEDYLSLRGNVDDLLKWVKHQKLGFLKGMINDLRKQHQSDKSKQKLPTAA